MRLSKAVWEARAAAHRERLAPVLAAHLERRDRGEKHPVVDFLFEYYRFRPAALRRWTPGVGVWLEGAEAFLERPHFVGREGGVGLPLEGVPERRRAGAQWILKVLERTAARRPMIGCSGLHEWAMVYELADVRHGQLPLRVEHGALREVVETQPVRCSHFDAYRFFSASAKGFNQMQPTAETRAVFEQPGCLHTNMDLYKWAFKLDPWIPSELVADAFEFACAVREVDMRASPYDLSGLGYEPIAIETSEGRAEYARAQVEMFERGVPIRSRLIEAIGKLL